MTEDQSIYQYIESSLVDGVLPDEFSLGDFSEVISTEGELSISMADGAMDGICIYHVQPQEVPEGIVDTIADALELACGEEEDRASASETLSGLLKEHRAIYLIDAIQQAALQVADKFGSKGLFFYAVESILSSTDRELVKLGLSILELSSDPGPDLKEVVRTLGMCDEFTLFCVWNARNWSEGNDEVFALARKAKGWGRIHAIEQLQPSSQEIKDWLLYEGIHNYVMPEYSALTCYYCADVAQRLEGTMGHEEFSAITDILIALLNDEGPMPGTWTSEDVELGLERYIKQAAQQAAQQALDDKDRECIGVIAACAERADWPALRAACEEL